MFKLPELDYDYQALEPAISRDIMELHHSKHHAGYVDKLNSALDGIDGVVAGESIIDILKRLDSLPEASRTAVRNNGGGHFNHSLFWQTMTPNGQGQPAGELMQALENKYGSFQDFIEQFNQNSLAIFGSGWAWLMPDMSIVTTANQDNPVMFGQAEPLMGLDVWEHAYYLDYKNVRADYLNAWWDVVNWQFVAQRLAEVNAR